jgi:hypothetical protein
LLSREFINGNKENFFDVLRTHDGELTEAWKRKQKQKKMSEEFNGTKYCSYILNIHSRFRLNQFRYTIKMTISCSQMQWRLSKSQFTNGIYGPAPKSLPSKRATERRQSEGKRDEGKESQKRTYAACRFLVGVA